MKRIILFIIIGAFFLAIGYVIGARHKEAENIAPVGCSNAWSNLEEYLARRPAPAPVGGIKSRLINHLTNDYVKGQYSLYFEDLDSGAWFGINETNLYDQWSLLKVKVAATVLKKVERREVNLDFRIKLRPVELDTATLFPELNHAGDELTVRELLEQLIRYSDNTASFALSRLFKADEFQDTLLAVGTLPAPSGKPRNFLPSISPKEYANALRDLYFAKYLSKPSSDLILALMANTVYDSQIRMGLPPGIKVAHKVGFNAGSGEFHDCGIVYLPSAPYILCIMSRDSTREESDRVISELSRLVYGFMTEKHAAN